MPDQALTGASGAAAGIESEGRPFRPAASARALAFGWALLLALLAAPFVRVAPDGRAAPPAASALPDLCQAMRDAGAAAFGGVGFRPHAPARARPGPTPDRHCLYAEPATAARSRGELRAHYHAGAAAPRAFESRREMLARSGVPLLFDERAASRSGFAWVYAGSGQVEAWYQLRGGRRLIVRGSGPAFATPAQRRHFRAFCARLAAGLERQDAERRAADPIARAAP